MELPFPDSAPETESSTALVLVTETVTTPVKAKRKSRVKQTNLDETALKVVKPPKALKPKKDNSLRALFRGMLSQLDIETLKRPWMATKSLSLVDTDEGLARWVEDVLADKSRWLSPYDGAAPCPIVAVDTEGNGLDTRILVHLDQGRDADGNETWTPIFEVKTELAGVCLSVDGISGIYVPLNHEMGANVSREALNYHLQRLFDVSHLVFYNGKFDREVMRLTAGIVFRDYPHFEDVQVLHYNNDPKAQLEDDTFSGDSGGLKALSKNELGLDQIELSTIGKVSANWCPVSSSSECKCDLETRKLVKHGKRMQYVPFTWIPTDIAVWYAASDAICTWLLWERKRKEAQSRKSVHQIDGRLIDSLTWIERQRFKIAEDPHRRLSKWHLRLMEERRENLRQIAIRHGWQELTDDEGNVIPDTKFNVDKDHLKKLLFEVKNMEVVKRTATGAPSTDKEALVDLIKMYPDDEFLKALQDYKGYVALHPDNLKFDPHDKSARIYLKQCVVAGGRLAASGGKFDRDGGFGMNPQAVKKVGGNWFVKGRILDPDFIEHDQIEPREESELHPSCFKDVEEETTVGWRQEGATEVFPTQFPEDVDAKVRVIDDYGDEQIVPKYAQDSQERTRVAVREKRKVRKKADGIINNHIANYLGYAICLVPKCKTCEEKHGILIENGRLDANQIINLRALFVAERGWTLFSSDYSNIEMRVAANCSKEPEFINEFLFGSGDFHSLTASKVFPEFNDPATPKAVRKALRDLAKIINFALLYGGTSFTIYTNMRKKKPGITMKETEAMVAAYWAGVPVFKAWCEAKQYIAKEELRCTTTTGRLIKFDSQMRAEHIRVPTEEQWNALWAYYKIRKRQRLADEEGRLEEAAHLQKIMDDAYRDPTSGVRNAMDYNKFMGKIQRVSVNVPLQGMAGDLMRMAINRIRSYATETEYFIQSVMRMHSSVHDELDYSVKNEYVPFVVPRITRLMKLRKLHEKLGWTVGIESDTEYGFSWDVEHHLTGDDDHVPAGWTEIEGLENYLPEDFSQETLDGLVRAITSGKQAARDRAWAWCEENLHPRAYKAAWHAFFYKDKDKNKQAQTDAEVVRKQMIAAAQLHEYWSIDETPDDDGALMETLEQYEARRGLKVADRGFMPPGGFLGALPLHGVRRPTPILLNNGDLALPEPARSLPELLRTEVPAQMSLLAGFEPEVRQLAAPKPTPVAQDDCSGMDELLGKDLPRPKITHAGSAPTIGLRTPPPPMPVEPVEEDVPVLRKSLTPEEIATFKRTMSQGLGTNTIRFRWEGDSTVRKLEKVSATAIPDEFLVRSETYA